jgi:hypothetical protein
VTRALGVTVEALVLDLRARGLTALSEPRPRRRLSELDEQQLEAVVDRLLNPKHIAWPIWTENEVRQLLRIKEGLQ